MRALRIPAACLALVVHAACANVEAPPGGPEDRLPPELIAVRPDSLSVDATFDGRAVFVFSERLSEQGVDDAVTVSPLTSRTRVSRSGDEIRVELERGWEAGQIYHITIRPALQDLFNNKLAAPVRLVFSTGPEIPETLVRGTLVDAATRKAEAGQRVEAIRAADSLVYATVTDSTGGFEFSRIPQGSYLIRGYGDLNQNRVLDAYEARDTLALEVGGADSTLRRLSLVLPDSTPPAIAEVTLVERKIHVKFDDFLNPAQLLSPSFIRLTGPAGPVGVALAQVLQPAADTTAADSAAAGVPPGMVPSQTLVLEPAGPLLPDTEYRIEFDAVTNIAGAAGPAEGTVTTPAAPAPAVQDSAAPPPTPMPPPDSVPPRRHTPASLPGAC